ncbi:MAG: 2-dehydro-3-deoxy-D-gluconate 5-dehydrogenase [Alphaproteobacteria bacterium MarineAlpha9_Bin7]|nr:MAG: 2-dehydro-3-deoxy-D-gluconate 5-dehydrogenase [Alphaproteobacteria bacterium MarineAlpha9_Bin7]
MMRPLAVGLARHHVRANSILLGWIDTDMTHKWLQRDTVNKHLLRRIPARRWEQPIDFGPIAIYLVSDASAYHTGDTFVIDGGYSLF